MTIRTQPIGFNPATGRLVLVLREEPPLHLEFEPTEEGMARLTRHLQGLQTLPQGQAPRHKAEALPTPPDGAPRTVYTFPAPARGIKGPSGRLSRERLWELTSDLFD